MRIAYLNPAGKMGGAETSLRELLACIRAAEPEWDLWLVLGEDGPLADIARALGVRVIVAPFPPSLARLGDGGGSLAATGWSVLKAAPATMSYIRSLAATLKEIGPDLIHTNGFKMHVLGACAGPRDVPLMWHIHDYVSMRSLMSRLLRRLRKRCAVAVVNSKSVARDLESICPGLRIVPIYNAIDLRRFAPTGEQLDLDKASGLAPAAAGTIRAGLVATFARWKGHKVFLEALSQLPAETPIRGYIVGGPIYQTSGSQWSWPDLRDEADRLGLASKVGFTGFVEDTAAAMRALDIVVHASTQPEPFGMVIIEAMACAKPVIASKAGGAVELFEEERTALAHVPGDAASLASQMARLALDASLRTGLGEAARVAVTRSFDGHRLASELTSLYREYHGAGREQADLVPSLNS